MTPDLYRDSSAAAVSAPPSPASAGLPPDRFRLRFAPGTLPGRHYVRVTLVTGLVAFAPPFLQILGLGRRSGPMHFLAAGIALGLTLFVWGIDGLARDPRAARTAWGRWCAALARRWWRPLLIVIRSLFMAEIVLFVWISLVRLGLHHGPLAHACAAALAVLVPLRHLLLLRAEYSDASAWRKLGEVTTALSVTSLITAGAAVLAYYVAPQGVAYLRPATPAVALVWISALLAIVFVWIVTAGRLLQRGPAPPPPRRRPPLPPEEY